MRGLLAHLKDTLTLPGRMIRGAYRAAGSPYGDDDRGRARWVVERRAANRALRRRGRPRP